MEEVMKKKKVTFNDQKVYKRSRHQLNQKKKKKSRSPARKRLDKQRRKLDKQLKRKTRSHSRSTPKADLVILIILFEE